MNLGRSMPLLATRGCPYECTFCSNPTMWTRRYITRDPKLLVDEMAHYVDKHDVVNFDFQDLTAIVNHRWAVALCEEMIERGLNVTWQLPSGTRAEVFDDLVRSLGDRLQATTDFFVDGCPRSLALEIGPFYHNERARWQRFSRRRAPY